VSADRQASLDIYQSAQVGTLSSFNRICRKSARCRPGIVQVAAGEVLGAAEVGGLSIEAATIKDIEKSNDESPVNKSR
jgi:hypothetical protein